MNKEQKILLGILALVGISVAGIYVELQKSQSQLAISAADSTITPTPIQPTSQPTESTISQTTTQPSSASKTVSTTVRFSVPKGRVDSLTVSATVKDGVVTAINYSQNSSNHESEEYYDRFDSRFSSTSVVGKKIGGVQLSRVGGASLTTEAFNQALSNLAQQI